MPGAGQGCHLENKKGRENVIIFLIFVCPKKLPFYIADSLGRGSYWLVLHTVILVVFISNG